MPVTKSGISRSIVNQRWRLPLCFNNRIYTVSRPLRDDNKIMHQVIKQSFHQMVNSHFISFLPVLKGKKLSLPMPIWGPSEIVYTILNVLWQLIHNLGSNVKTRKMLSVDFSKTWSSHPEDLLINRLPLKTHCKVIKTWANCTNTVPQNDCNKKP